MRRLIVILALAIVGCVDGNTTLETQTSVDTSAESRAENIIEPVIEYDGMTVDQFEASMAMWAMFMELHGHWQGSDVASAPVNVQNDFNLYVESVADIREGSDAQEVVADFATQTDHESSQYESGGAV